MAEQKDLMLCKFFTTFARWILNRTQRHKATEYIVLCSLKIKSLYLCVSVFHN